MRPSVEDIKAVIEEESQKHCIQGDSIKVDVIPEILSADHTGFNHDAKCICGKAFRAVTQNSAKTPGGQQQLGMALAGLLSDHLKTALATAIYQLHEVPS